MILKTPQKSNTGTKIDFSKLFQIRDVRELSRYLSKTRYSKLVPVLPKNEGDEFDISLIEATLGKIKYKMVFSEIEKSFSAETAKILSPNKKVLLPVMNADCLMAQTITKKDLQKYKDEHPDTKIITYVNTTAEIKALSDCICTSTNGLKIIEHYLDQGEKILYTPDQNLGKYAMKISGKQFEVWNGCCPIHHFLDKRKVLKQKELHPDALIIAHPECQLDILEISDYVGSTAQLLSFVKK